MTRLQFIAKAIRAYERELCIPAGWWGTYTDFTNGNARIKFSDRCWTLSAVRGKRISKHDSRAFAISKAKKL